MILFESQHLRKRVVAYALWILAFTWVAIILFLSSQTGEKSEKLSTSIAEQIADIPNLSNDTVTDINRKLRILAHIACFFVLGILTSSAAATTFTRSHSFLWPLVPCIAFAFFDEIKKHYIVGRHCSFAEAWLNTLGCSLGFIIVGIVYFWHSKNS